MRDAPDLSTDDDQTAAFRTAVVEGLSQAAKTLPCRYFYDERGSALFEDITRLPEYYPTRIEAAILAEHAHEIVAGFPPDVVLVEYGSGSSIKTERLLRYMRPGSDYLAIDVSPDALDEAQARIYSRFPHIKTHVIIGSFTEPLAFPAALARRPLVGFFPGSTIGNFPPDSATALLAKFKSDLGPASTVIVGVDLKKDPATLVAAYDDNAGVTAAFNLNLLARINRELGGTFDLDRFAHRAVYNVEEGRIEMHLVSQTDQDVRVGSTRVHFSEGETIHTENSYKYAITDFQKLARDAGWHPARVWTDPRSLFSVHALT